MAAVALEVVFVKQTQYSARVAAHGFDQLKLYFHLALIVSQARREHVGVAAKKLGLVHGDDALHAVGVHKLEISDMTDDLPGRPSTGDGRSVELRLTHPGDGLPQPFGPRGVFVDKFLEPHLLSLAS